MPAITDKKLAAVCGLFCPACTIYIGTREDPDRLKASARRTGAYGRGIGMPWMPYGKEMLFLLERLHHGEMRR